MADYIVNEVEKRWQKNWADKKVFHAQKNTSKEKYYLLVMFPYPSGKLHMGHVRNYSIGDVFARFNRMLGKNVIHPIGWDSFGLPAENAAIKNNIHPKKWTKENIAHMGEQLKMLGISYDWDREIATCDPEYYKWNQWFFIQMVKKGLVFRKSANVNWCPSCKTVLANEQVNQGACWRCDSQVEQKELEQWFVKITDYADELLDGHKELTGWPEQVLSMQKNWIGKSYGAEMDFSIANSDKKLKIFTTRPDTVFGVTFMVVSPEHQILKEFRDKIKNWKEVEEYITKSASKSNIERSSSKEKTGIKLDGVSAINPATGKNIPIFVADYVLVGYGTGAIMAVPAHDQRDWEFAKKYGIEIIEVIKGQNSDITKSAYEDEGIMVNSEDFDGIKSTDAFDKMSIWVEEKGFGKKTTNFKLREWLISRQRYWGTPIPMIHCPQCGTVPVDEKDLPVRLPDNIKFTDDGKSPLQGCDEFVNTTCPKCGGKAKRETDTMDTFVDSSWYYARYTDPKNNTKPFESDTTNYWLPVDQYVGGIEHACMHLIYSRFWHKIMRDLGLVNTNEPFKNLLTQGMVTLRGSAMSKSKGNVVSPDEIIEKYGADTARLFILFAAPPEKQLDWSDDGVEGSWKFINRVWRLQEVVKTKSEVIATDEAKESLLRSMHVCIKKVTEDIGKEHQLNTAISSVMELVNIMYVYKHHRNDDGLSLKVYETLVLLLAPFTPHLCEEIWSLLGHNECVSIAQWPKYEEKYIKQDVVEVPVQVNGKLRGKVFVNVTANEQEVKELVLKDEKVKSSFDGKQIIKFIYVQNKIVNIVVK
ncbi:MAG: leucine--tRNA ligase [Endomicrobiaceae bacterium]|nr:leucine--tRNA ligase [Endomicrobiaceae bacterium]